MAMTEMGKAVLNLIKSIFARPAKQKNSTLHWVKANKPLGEMMSEERKEFASRLADEALDHATPKSNKDKAPMQKQDSSRIWLIVFIVLLIFFNWNKVPIIGDNAKALNFVKKSCVEDKTVKIEVREKFAEKAASLNAHWNRLADAHHEVRSTSDVLTTLARNAQEESAEYKSQYSAFASALYTINGICESLKR
jgi:Sec-independent protein translocase protein TatA